MTTDYFFGTPYGKAEAVVLQKKTAIITKFVAYNGSTRNSCVSWFSSRPIDVQYTGSGHGRSMPWRVSNGADFYLGGTNHYAYRFVRRDWFPVYIVFDVKTPTDRCGYRGSTEQLPQIASVLDVFTDWLGLARIKPGFDTGTMYARNAQDAALPYRQSAQPRQQASTRSATIGNNMVRAIAKPKAPSPDQQRANLDPVDMSRLAVNLSHLGYNSTGPNTGYKDWQRKHGYRPGSPITVAQYRKMQAQIEANRIKPEDYRPRKKTTKASSISRKQWANIQRALRRKGCNPGAIDGVPGGKTKRAIACWQKKNGQRATGNPTRKQLRRILR